MMLPWNGSGFLPIRAKELARLKVTNPLWRFERDGGRVIARRGTYALISSNAGTLAGGIMTTEKKEGWTGGLKPVNTARRA